MTRTAKAPASATAAAALAREVLAAVRAEPGRVPDDLTAAVREAGLDDAETGALVAAVHEAQASDARLRRRTAEVEALFSTARELVRLRDVDEVLRRLVQRAHDLVGTDVTYLSELDPATGDLHVRHSAGTVTPEFRDLRVPTGFGLASKVVRTREPAWTARYAGTDDVPHDPRIDAAVTGEGLVSFLGVPLAVGDEVLGALFACNRFAHDSSPDEILLLSAFADHAAAVLHSARVLADATAATARAEDAYRELEQHLAATELAGAVHEELTTAVISGGSVVDVVATLARTLHRRVWAVDAQGRALRVGADAPAGLPPRAATADAVARSATSGHVAEVRDDGRGWLVVAIRGADRVAGAIVAEEQEGFPDDVARRTLERAAHVAALVSFQQDAVSAIRDERRSRWLRAVADGRALPGGDGDDAPAPDRVTGCAVIGAADRDAASAVAAVTRAVGEDGFVAARGAHVLVAWTVPDPRGATERLRRLTADVLRTDAVTAVVCDRDAAPGRLGALVARAGEDLRLLAALGVPAGTVSSDALAPYHALAPGDPETVARFIRDLLGGVLDRDAARGSRLFDTLAAYFDAGENRAVVAEALHVHKNTVQQRLERIQTLVPGDLADAEFRFRLQAAVRLERLRRDVGGEG